MATLENVVGLRKMVTVTELTGQHRTWELIIDMKRGAADVEFASAAVRTAFHGLRPSGIHVDSGKRVNTFDGRKSFYGVGIRSQREGENVLTGDLRVDVSVDSE